jgi:hypothetical protein
MSIEAPMLDIESERMQRLLRCPCPTKALTVENEGDFIAFSNDLQGLLALRKFGDDAGQEGFTEWFKEHSVQFRQAFEETISGNPFYFGEYEELPDGDGNFAPYETIRDIPEAKLIELEQKIYN